MTIRPMIRKHRPSSNGLCLIYIQYQHKSRTVLFSTEFHIKPEYLVTRRGRPIVDSTIDISNIKKHESIIKFRKRSDEAINRILEEMQSQIMEIVADLRHEGFEPNSKLVKFRYDEALGKFDEKKENLETIVNAIDYNISHNPKLKSEQTKKNYGNFKNKIVSFLKKQNRTGDLPDLTNAFVEDFEKYLASQLKLSENSVWGHLKSLKATVRFMKDRGFSIDIDPSKIESKSIEGLGLYITQAEFKRLWEVDLSDTPKLDRIRDLFCLQCQTGLRISDLSRLKKVHIKEELIKIRQHKTTKDVLIPITDIARSIFKRYDYNLPVISAQKYNDYIKEICAVAAINEEIEVPDYRDGEKKYTTRLKWELISNHDAIRTFITHGVEKGISPKVMSMITGKTLKTLLKHYYQTDEDRVREEVRMAFSQKPDENE